MGTDYALRLLEMEQYLRVQIAIAATLAKAERLNDGCRDVLRTICENLNADSSTLWFSVGDHLQLTSYIEWPSASVEMAHASGPHAPADTHSQRLAISVYRTGKAAWVRLAQLPPEQTELRLTLAVPAVPARAGGQVVAVMLFHLRQAKEPDETELQLFDAIGQQMASFIERMQLQERTSLLAQLEAEKTRWQTIFESMPDLVCICNERGEITFMNSAAQRTANSPFVPGQTIEERFSRGTLFRADGTPLTLNELPLCQVLRTGHDVRSVEIVQPRAGQSLIAIWHASPLRDDAGNILGAVAVGRDVTERRRSRQEQQQLIQQLALEQARLQTILDQMPAGLIIAEAPDGKLILSNRQVEQIQGYSSDPDHNRGAPGGFVAFRPDGTRIEPENLPVTRALRHGETVADEEMKILRGDGTMATISVNAGPIRDDDGQIIAAVTTFTDITARKQAEQTRESALSRTVELYQTSRRIGMARTPQDLLRVLLATRYLKDACCATASIFDQPWTNDGEVPEGSTVIAEYNKTNRWPSRVGMHEPTDPAWLAAEEARHRAISVSDVRTDTTIGDIARASVHKLGVRGFICLPLTAAGACYGTFKFFFEQPHTLASEDVRHIQGLTDQAAVAIHNMRLLDAEAAARRQAEHANELRLRFLGMISHELRTPLTSIKGFATTLLAPDVTWEENSQREFIAIIDQESDKLTDMIDQILDLSRIESGTLRIAPQAQALSAIVGAAQPQLITLAHQHALSVNIPPDLPLVYADSQRIAQVLLNLVGNAAKYSPHQSSITISAETSDGATRGGAREVCVTVGDQGPGIMAQDRPFVFEAFRRGSDRDTRQTKGAGLGLAICKGIVEAHGGHIWLQDHDGPGTLISFTLPITETHQAAP